MNPFAQKYFALKSSLPYLKFMAGLPISDEKFLSYCSAFLSGKEFDALAALSLLPDRIPQEKEQGVPAAFYRFENSLRNALAMLRGGKLKRDARSFQKTDAPLETEASAAASSAFAVENPMDRERMLDQARWTKLEGMELDHTADFDALCIYRFKLLILAKWDGRKEGKAQKNLEKAVSSAEKEYKNH